MVSQSRRSFIKRQLALGACMTAGLDVISTTAHAADLQGYKALVCVYCAGGNDSYNMFVPASGTAHQDYADVRRFLALPSAQVLPVTPVTYSDGQAYGFHPSMTESQRLFDSGDLAVIANVGNLVVPVTKAEFEERSVALPSQLFSHNDQTDEWLTSDARGSSGLGWAGRTMDVMYPGSYPAPSPSISIGGNSLWQVGRNVRAYEVGVDGVGAPYAPGHSGPLRLRDAYRIMRQSAIQENNILVKEHAMTLERAEDFSSDINGALEALESAPEFNAVFPENGLAPQLEMVARLIAVRGRLDSNLNRQVFFVRIGGFDTHNEQAGPGYSKHAELLRTVDSALAAFHRALADMQLTDSVTTFTATEFGRTLAPNGSGTDHGWGGHNLVMGGAVNGGDIYGQMPQISRDSVDAIRNGRIIPTTSVDQYSATLARWFGLSEPELASVFPNLRNFATSNLGFMA